MGDAFHRRKESARAQGKKKTLADLGETEVYPGGKTESSKENILNFG